ncbi:MAG: hypothetical protein WEB00_03200 [Dehalococcoidia bacterium]
MDEEETDDGEGQPLGYEGMIREFSKLLRPEDRPKRGAPAGNMNAVKHGRRSRRLSEAKRVARALAKAPAYAVSPEEEFRTAMRWSRTERAVLIVAVMKRGKQIEHIRAVAAALENGEDPPAPPVVTLTGHEEKVYRMYLGWQRWAAKLGRVGATEEEVKAARREVKERVAEAMEEWELVRRVVDELGGRRRDGPGRSPRRRSFAGLPLPEEKAPPAPRPPHPRCRWPSPCQGEGRGRLADPGSGGRRIDCGVGGKRRRLSGGEGASVRDCGKR